VLWKITPLFAGWLAWEGNWLFKEGFLSEESTVLELGCGISGVVAMGLAPRVGRYVATDQEYVFKCLRRNLEGNAVTRKVTSMVKYGKKQKRGVVDASAMNVELLALDWETSSLEGMDGLLGLDSAGGGQGLDLVLACDCIYNEALIEPFVRTCVELCRLSRRMEVERPTLCVIAQQLRSHVVFDAWLAAFHGGFRVWRVPDELLVDGLKEGSGYVVHVGVLRDGV